MIADPTGELLSKAQAYLRSAAVLYELEDYDSCASRAYFAMRYAVQAVLYDDAGILSGNEDVRTAFVETVVAPGLLPPHAAEVFDNAYTLYQQGDYGPGFAIAPEVAERMLQEAEAFVNTLDRLIDASR